MKLLPKVLLGASEELDYLDQCRQLLSLALVHPAFPQEDREALTFWLSRLDEKHRTIMERTPLAQQKPPPIPPKKIYQQKTGDFGSMMSSNGASRIYINGCLNNRLTPAQSEGNFEHSDGSVESFNPEDDELRRCSSLQAGQSLYNPADHPPPPPPPSNGYDEFIQRERSKSSSLPVRSASLFSLPGMSGFLDEMPYMPPIDWKPGMKGKIY